MTIGAGGIVTFSPGLDIKAEDMNQDFANLNNATEFIATLTGSSTNTDHSTNAALISNSTYSGLLSVTSLGIITVTNAGTLYDYYGLKYQPWSHFNATGSGTYNHNWIGTIIPNLVMVDPINATAVTWAANNGGTTTVDINLGAAVSFNADASYLL